MDEDDEEKAPEGEQPARELRAYSEWVCTDPDAYGHPARWATSNGYGTERRTLAEMSVADADNARAERRDVIEQNAAWRSATTVRRDHLRTVCTRKTPPAGTAAFLATTLARDPYVLTHHRRTETVANRLRLRPHAGADEVEALLSTASDKRAQVLALVQVLAAYEAATALGDWRRPRTTTRRYLRFLTNACGYTRADVERRACGDDPGPAAPRQ